MSKTIRIPVQATKKTSDGKFMQMQAISGPLRFPDGCLYCGAADSVNSEIQIIKRVSGYGAEPQWKLESKAGLCRKHIGQVKWISVILIAFGILVGLAITIPNILRIMNFGMAVTFGITGTGWMAYIAGLIFLVGFPVIYGMFAAALLKFILGIFIPPFRHYRFGLFGVKIKLSKPSVKDHRSVHTLDFTFANDAVGRAFETLNPVSESAVNATAGSLKREEDARRREKEKRVEDLEFAKIEKRVNDLARTANDVSKMNAVRNQAIAGLSLIDHPHARAQIIHALKDDSPEIAASAAATILRRGFEEAANPLIEVLKRKGEKFAPLRVLAIKALMEIAPEKAAQPLLEVLADRENENPQVLRDAIYGLADLEEPRAIEPLKVLSRHKSSKVQVAAENALRIIQAESENTSI